MSSTPNIPHEAVDIDVDSLETSAGRLICLIKPTWISKKLNFKKLGMDENNIYYSIFPMSDEDEQHGVVIKVYPANSDVYIDHKKELQLIDQLVQLEIAPHVLLTFNNGYLSHYALGKILDDKEEHTHQLIAQQLAEFHSKPIKRDQVTHFTEKLKQFIDLFTKKNAALQDRIYEIKENLKESDELNTGFLSSLKSAIGLDTTSAFPLTLQKLESQLKDTSWAELSTEIDFIDNIFHDTWSKHGLPDVLCLNNTNVNNFVYDSKNKTTSIVDFDHCCTSYFLLDIVSYFLELTKTDPENKYPRRQLQKLFLTDYLKHSSLNLTNIIFDPLKPTDSELERLCDLCGLLIAPVHLYWALWAFLQALLAKPTITFDYITYGKARLAEYRKHKGNFFLPLYSSQSHS